MIKIGLAGDVMIGRLMNEHLDRVPPFYIWGDLLPLFHSNDLNIVNLEAALTKNEHAAPKVFNFKADPVKVQTLVEASVHVVNLANNHVLDYGEAGLLETLATLKKARIQYVGAGKTIAEAKAPVILQRKGIKIGILGCTDNEPSWRAGENRPGTFYLQVGDLAAIRPAIEELRPEVDILILTIHWGPNMVERPPPEFRRFAHELIDLGVDLIHGHSAHISQGIEVYKGKCILYDTGDFIDDYYVDPILRNDRSFFFIAEADKAGIRALRLVPTLIAHFQVNRAKGPNAEETLERMRLLSKEFLTILTREDNELFLPHVLPS